MLTYILTFVQITYTIALPIVLGVLTTKSKQNSQTKQNSIQADMLTLRLNLIMLHDQYVPTGKITRYAYDTFEEMWTLYHDGYNGNHLTNRFHQQVQNLQIKG